MTEFNLEEAEKLASDIQKKMKASMEFMDWIQAGGEIIDEHDIYPPELYEQACRPENMKILLAAVTQLRPLQEKVGEIESLKKDVSRLKDELRQANVRHDGAYNWAMNNAKTLDSHLRVCRHDEVKGLKLKLEATGYGKVLTFAQHKALWGK